MHEHQRWMRDAVKRRGVLLVNNSAGDVAMSQVSHGSAMLSTFSSVKHVEDSVVCVCLLNGKLQRRMAICCSRSAVEGVTTRVHEVVGAGQ